VTFLPVAVVAAAGWQQVSGPPELSFARDHGAHLAHRSEWWYITGMVGDVSGVGERYGLQLTFFRQGLDPRTPGPEQSQLRARQVLAAHLAVTDIARGGHRTAQRLRRIGAGLAGCSESDLQVWLEDWELRRRGDGSLWLSASDRNADVAVQLVLQPLSNLVRHGDNGYSQKGEAADNASVYLSWTRLHSAGELRIGSQQIRVSGEAWFDHEWGTSQLDPGTVGWDWFGLRLDHDRELMLYRLRSVAGATRVAATLVSRRGGTEHLGSEDIKLQELATWVSPHSGASYPAGWRLQLPSFDIDIEVRPLVADAEMDMRRTTATVYWEGPVSVSGTSVGEGYVELTG
jgi:predicted secreted hydrolase